MWTDPKKAGSKKRLKAYQYEADFDEEAEEYGGYIQQNVDKKKQKKQWVRDKAVKKKVPFEE